ncbi:hypothetical protein Clacol_007383 [Clathrus columnatus]|uniref:Coatomer subunit beta n=1 Tax=Clathrus columnatus TaxID=1419009 RepID=A0AAV5AJ28_9AGAM|nr:hypothetical protein Clacol_007383 [Clathrus columnatus]
MTASDATCFTVVFEDPSELPSSQDLRNALQKGSDEVKLDTLRKIIVSTLNGNTHPQLLMPIIQFVLPSRNKQLKKLLHFYWEVCPKYDEDGKLKQEMILVCNAIRNDLQHPNEYIRGATLRFLTKISKDAELLEPLIPTVRTCLEHRHAYVRKNAVFAVYTIYRAFENLIPDAPELMQTFLVAESDSTCKRNAFVSLTNIAMPKAVEYIMQVFDQIPNFDELLQMAIIDLIRKDCLNDTPYRPRYIRCIFELLNASSHSVKYEAATTLTTLTQNPAAIKAAASALIELIQKESDNNVKLIVLDRVDMLQQKHEHILDGLVLDILEVLSSPDMEVRHKAIALVLKMVSNRNVEDVVGFLKKQLQKTMEQEQDKNIEYRQLLIQSIHICAIRFSEIAASVIHALMEFLNDSGNSAAVDVIAFVREVVQKFPDLRKSITGKLLETMGQIKAGKVFRGALWILGETLLRIFGTFLRLDIEESIKEIRNVLGEIPILASEQRLLDVAGDDEEAEKEEGPKQPSGGKPRVLPDGTYATETAYSSTAAARLEAVKAAAKPPLRALILSGDFYTGAVLASTLTKLLLRYSELNVEPRKVNALRAEAMLIMTSIIRVGQSKFVTQQIDEDSQERVLNCLQTLSDLKETDAVHDIFLKDTKAAYAKMVATEENKAAIKREKETKAKAVQIDDLLNFRQFSKKSAVDGSDEYERDLTRATGSTDVRDDFVSSLNKVHQLTDVLIVNQTSDTLQNLCIEFATLGDLKLVEKPSTHTLAPHGFHSIKATIKVASTETGVIFGNIIWESGTTESCVILSDVHIDIMDYIKPAYCNEAQFRSMWTEFEWENRVNVNTTLTNLREYLEHIMKSTNMSCLTPEAALSGECDFLSANMYARSLFGEDALANLSIEKAEGSGVIIGHVRIRSKTQGIALSLGDKITLAQKGSGKSTN